MNNSQLLSLFMVIIFAKTGFMEQAFEYHKKLTSLIPKIERLIRTEGYILDSYIDEGFFGYVFRARKIVEPKKDKAIEIDKSVEDKAIEIDKSVEYKAIKIAWDWPRNEDNPSFPLCTNYATQMKLAEDNSDIFSPIKLVKMFEIDPLEGEPEPKYGICVVIMNIAVQDLKKELNFLFDNSDDNSAKEAKLVTFIKSLVDMVLKLNNSGYLHGDISVGNILLMNEKGKIVPKLNDFDLMRKIEKIRAKNETWCEKSVFNEKVDVFDTVKQIIKANSDLVSVSDKTLKSLEELICRKYLDFVKKACPLVTEEFLSKFTSIDRIKFRV